MKKGKYKVLDLFCGCGGISLGYQLAGFDIIGGIDFNQDAVNTFAKNFHKAKTICGDITTISNETILENYSEVDVIVGGPPCQGFSSANRWQKEKDDPRNKLFFEYIRCVELLKPKVLMIENVRGLLTKDNGYAKERIFELLAELGYSVNVQVLDASEYGVPQVRKRAIFVGVRKDYKDIEFDFNTLHKIEKKVTVSEAISDLYLLEEAGANPKKIPIKPSSDYQKFLRKGSKELSDHEIRYPSEAVQQRISFVKQGENWMSVPPELWPNGRQNRHSSAYKRLDENDQSCTIDTGNAHSNYFHPLFNRIPTIREAARLQSFIDGFEFTGPRGSRYKQVGNAVPPLLAKAVAVAIKKILDNENN